MSPVFARRTRGTVLLVALCFVAVMGIALGSYLALCSRAMQLSNRSFQAELSKQLAEAGLEEALRAFNKNDWNDWTIDGMSVDWSLDPTTKRATATITYPSTKFGQGVGAQVKIRVDNYDAHVLGSSWISSKSYQIGDVVGHNGIWYSCVKAHVNQAPTANNFTNWVPTHIPWRWSKTRSYKAEELVNHLGTWYRATSTSVDQEPPHANWRAIPTVYFQPSIDYTNEAILYWGGVWYRYDSGWDAAPAISWRYRPGQPYTFGDLVYYGGIWYRFINASPTASITPGTNASYWENALGGTVHSWLSSNINYNIGDVVFYSPTAQWYRCLKAHSSSASLTPANTTYWSNTPALTQQWKAGTQYAANDTVAFNGVWYLCVQTHTSSISFMPPNASYWVGANTSNPSYIWNANTPYAVNAYRCYGGVWYRCIATNTGQSPNNITYWSAALSQSTGVTTGAPLVYAQAIVSLGDGTTSRTQLRGLLASAPLFPNAAGATTTLTIDGGTGTIDSYDHSLGTTYESQRGSPTNYNAVLAAGTEAPAGTSTLLTVGNGTTLNGFVASISSSTPPYAPRTSFGNSAIVKNATSPASPNVDLTQISRSPHVPKFDPHPTPLSTAFTSWNFPYGRSVPTNFSGDTTNNEINLGTSGGVTPERYYYNGALNIGDGYDIVTLNIHGPVKLYVNGNLFMRAGGTLKVHTTGSLELHTDTALRTATGYIGIINATEDPKKLLLISDSSATTVQQFFSPTPSTNAFHGLIYAPNTTATLGVDIRTGVTIYGAISARLIKFNNEANLHYDTSLRYATFSGVDQPYTVTDWRELPATEAATMP